jgi:hypothetical protein
MARDRRPDRLARPPRLAPTRWNPALTGGSTSPLLSGTIASSGGSGASIFCGTTEIMKEIIGRNLGL